MGIALSPADAARLVALLDRIALEPQNLTAIDEVSEGVDRHLADSLAGLAIPEIASATAIADIGSGAGFPGLALAVALPEASVTLVESERRKAEWLRRASAEIPNLRVVADRSEHLAATERESVPVAVMRALGPLPVALELAAPLVAVGGCVVAWRGDVSQPATEADGAWAARELGLTPRQPVPSRAFPGSRRRLHVFDKTAPTPRRYQRRPGRAATRPLGVPR